MHSADPDTSTPFFSVVMPTHNRSRLIARGIESLVQQTFTSWELIVVDDGGSDDTRAVVESFGDARVRYFWKENEERSIARNFGIERARGAYVNFLDSDDFHKATHFELAHRLLSSGAEVPVLHLGFCDVDADTGAETAGVVPRSDEVLDKVLVDNPFVGNAMFVRRDALRDVTFVPSKDAVISEDKYLWMRLAVRYPILVVPSTTTCVLSHGGRSIASIDPYRYERALRCIIDALGDDAQFRRKLGPRRFDRTIAYMTLGVAQQFLINDVRSKRNAIRYMTAAARMSPSTVATRRFLVCARKLLIVEGGH